MELRARTRPTLRRAAMMAALTALLVPAAPATADAAKAPVVKRITPKHVFVGETMTVRGRHFRPGFNKNTVAFKRRGAKVVLVRSAKSTKKMLTVKLPKRLEKILPVLNGTPVATRLQVRVLSKRFGRRYTPRRRSPIVGPERPPAPPKPPAADPDADCDLDGSPNRVDADDDNDLLPDSVEAGLSKLLDRCKADTDGDGVEDGYEVQSARDLNDDEHQNPNAYTPYPRKLPFPNPLDREDANTDHDGDTLTLKDEYDLWKYTVANGGARTLTPLSYSAGEQYSRSTRSGRRVPTLPAAGYDKQIAFRNWATANHYLNVSLAKLGTLDVPQYDGNDWFDTDRELRDIRDFDRDGDSAETATYYDRDGNHYLDDAERDEDADGLSNQWESTGCMTRGYWDGLYDKETKYYLSYGALRLDDPDSDGDGVRDGADDQDHDDVPNVMECSRRLALDVAGHDPADLSPVPARPWKGFVNPFNPCLPHPASRTCKQYVIIGGSAGKWAPFNPDDTYYLIRN